MTQAIEWGAEIATNGVKPEWLGDEDVLQWVNDMNMGPFSNEGWSYWLSNDPAVAGKMGWDGIRAIRLPASHEYYTATSKGFEYWPGGDEAPSDWTGEGEVLFRDGTTGIYDGYLWDHTEEKADIIGYKKKDSAVSDIEDCWLEVARTNIYKDTQWNDNEDAWTLDYIKSNANEPFSQAIYQLAAMYKQYEPHRKPVDPDVLAVREIYSCLCNVPNEIEMIDLILEGKLDNTSDFQAALAAFKKHKGT